MIIGKKFGSSRRCNCTSCQKWIRFYYDDYYYYYYPYYYYFYFYSGRVSFKNLSFGAACKALYGNKNNNNYNNNNNNNNNHNNHNKDNNNNNNITRTAAIILLLFVDGESYFGLLLLSYFNE